MKGFDLARLDKSPSSMMPKDMCRERHCELSDELAESDPYVATRSMRVEDAIVGAHARCQHNEKRRDHRSRPSE